jgi:hypothetical protein
MILADNLSFIMNEHILSFLRLLNLFSNKLFFPHKLLILIFLFNKLLIDNKILT